MVKIVFLLWQLWQGAGMKFSKARWDWASHGAVYHALLPLFHSSWRSGHVVQNFKSDPLGEVERHLRSKLLPSPDLKEVRLVISSGFPSGMNKVGNHPNSNAGLGLQRYGAGRQPVAQTRHHQFLQYRACSVGRLHKKTQCYIESSLSYREKVAEIQDLL